MAETFDEIIETGRLYVEGMTFGDEGKLRRAFHPGASSIGHFEGGLEWDGLDAVIAVFRGNAAPAGTAPFWRVDSVSVAGDTAVVRVTDGWAGARFVDTLSLIRHEGRWVIVAKLFFHDAEASAGG